MHTFKFLNKLFKDIKIELIKNLREQLTILRNRNKILKNSLQNNYHYKFNNNNNDFSMNFNVSLIGDILIIKMIIIIKMKMKIN